MPWAWQKGKGAVHPKSSKTSSAVSLSPSQLNAVIMDMLNVQPAPNNCQNSCRGDPITTAGQRNQMIKMLVIILIPILTLVGLSGNSFGSTIDNYLTANGIRETLRFSLEMSFMVRSLQRERDASALYLSAISPETKGFLLKRYQETDEAIQNLLTWPVQLSTSIEGFATSETFLKKLNRHRYELDTLQLTFQEELQTYSDWIEVFIRWFYTTIVEAKGDLSFDFYRCLRYELDNLERTFMDEIELYSEWLDVFIQSIYENLIEDESVSVWKAFVAYQELLVAAEYLGRERAMGVIFYNRGYFQTREDYLYFAEAQDTSNASFTAARLYSDMARDIFDAKLEEYPKVIEKIQEMRADVKTRSQVTSLSGSSELANAWFDNMTFYQDIVREIMTSLAERIDELLATKQRSDLTNIIVICLLFGAVIIICPIIVYAVYSLTLDIQRCSIHIADRTKELSREKKRTDTLLYQMLPKTVAEQLKRNETVETEEFREATIMFSDIVGFTEISSRSSPLQIVEMLNMIYSCLDDRIEMYDVYKVETIGDAYLVVSGVPKMNGNLHASEIASLSLDIMEHVNRMEIQHIPGTYARLRIGMHSGPVVAGIVGTKMPHYCVFGESVNVASRIEALGLPCKIHMSETTANILTELGGFLIKAREEFPTKDDHDLVMAFRGNVQTFWLNGKEGYALLESDVSANSPEHRKSL